MNDNLNGMTREQLQAALAAAQEELSDMEDERRFTLGQTGVHIGAAELKRINGHLARKHTPGRARRRDPRCVESGCAGLAAQSASQSEPRQCRRGFCSSTVDDFGRSNSNVIASYAGGKLH